MKFAVLRKLRNGQMELVGFRLHKDRHEASILSGILNRVSGTDDYTMYEMVPCAGPKPADVDAAMAELRK